MMRAWAVAGVLALLAAAGVRAAEGAAGRLEPGPGGEHLFSGEQVVRAVAVDPTLLAGGGRERAAALSATTRGRPSSTTPTTSADSARSLRSSDRVTGILHV